MKFNRRLSILWITVLLLASCGRQQTTCVRIVCTSDVHGNIFPYDFLTGDSVRGSLARVSSYLKEQRQSSAFGDNVVYLDCGDMILGSPATYCYNTFAIGHRHIAAEALNYLQCDATVWGNNEIKTGGPTYQRYADDLNCPVLGGNIMFEDSQEPFLPPYTIIEREGLQIAIIGLTTPVVPHMVPRNLWAGLEFTDMEHAARRWMNHLHEHASPDLIVGLFHSGYGGGIITDDYIENATRAVAERVPGFDAIFYGHDHQATISKVVNVQGDTVLLLNPGKYASNVAVLDAVVSKEGTLTLEATLASTGNYDPDPDYLTVLAPHNERVQQYIERMIGTSSTAAEASDAFFGPSAFVDFMHQMQLDISGAKISFAAPLVYDGVIPEGNVCVSDIYRLYPYENTLYVLWLTGQEIKDYLEMSYSMWINQMTSSDDHLLQFSFTEKGTPQLRYPYYYFDSAAGIIYDVDVTRPAGKRVNIKRMADGKPFCLDKRYMVAMNSYRAHGGGGLLAGAGVTREQLDERIDYTTTADLRFYMLSYIEMKKTISPKPLNHWKFVPERWTIPAAQRDRILLDEIFRIQE